jgi:hypothetical protein
VNGPLARGAWAHAGDDRHSSPINWSVNERRFTICLFV